MSTRPLIPKAVAEHQQALRPHVEQQVDDAEVGQEAQTLLKHLIVGLRAESRVGRAEVLLGVDALAAVLGLAGGEVGAVRRAATQVRLDVDEGAHQAAQRFVEVHEELVPLLVEGAEVVPVVLEERGVVVGRLQGVPVQVAPVAVVGDADVAHQALRRVGLHDGHGERQRPVGRGDGAAVAVGLLHVVVILLHHGAAAGHEVGVVLHRRQVGR